MANGKPAVDHVTDREIGHGQDWDRRKFVKCLSALAGSAGLLGYDLGPAAAEPPLETTRIRLSNVPAICVAPQYAAEALLKAEGFTDVQYVTFDSTTGADKEIRTGKGTWDVQLYAVGALITGVDAGSPIVALAGVHLGCYELFGTERVRAIRDLRGKTVSVDGLGGPQHIFLSTMLAYVGLDPRKDINWVAGSSAESMKLFAEGKVDAFLGFPPEPQELRAKKIGHVVVNTSTDKPWSQYYCCMLAGNGEFVQKHPVATKRAVRAILKAADLCAQEPERAAQMIVDKGFTKNYDYALETLKEVSYNAWRTYDPEDTIRFHALRLHEAGMIKSSPQKLIAQGTDWRYLNELKRELKA
jgi:NitT/TauT family transport system substrate-binding protein